jgi:putative transposase
LRTVAQLLKRTLNVAVQPPLSGISIGSAAGCARSQEREAAAGRFLELAIDLNGVPEKITFDKGRANTSSIESIRAGSGADIELRRIKYFHNIVEQNHRAIKRSMRPMMGFKSFWSATSILAGIETVHMIRKAT